MDTQTIFLFKDYIYKKHEEKEKEPIDIIKTPEELLKEAGYTLYECKNEDDIQSFKKYYKTGEELCTFRGNRLNKNYVFFAVKDNINVIKREDFAKPERQDEYGTSVISIQFSKNGSHTLSIKNRYNHTVANPDATFSNNLDNIIEGLTESFKEHYRMDQKYVSDFEIPGYVRANDGKYYKYNLEIDNIYYCPDNIIIDNFKVITETTDGKNLQEKERYIVLDYFILDLKEKTVSSYDNSDDSTFHEVFENIDKIEVINKDGGKEITTYKDEKEDMIITLDKYNNIIKFAAFNLKEIPDSFIQHNRKLEELFVPEVEIIKHAAFFENIKLNKIYIPKATEIGVMTFFNNLDLEELHAPSLEELEKRAFYKNRKLQKIYAPKLNCVYSEAFCYNEKLEFFYSPNLETLEIGNFYRNRRFSNFSVEEIRNLSKSSNKSKILVPKTRKNY